MARKFINLPEYEVLGLSLASGVLVDGLLAISGQAPIGPDGEILGDGIAEQTHIVMTNLVSTLKAAGMTADDVIKTTVYLKSADDFVVMDKTYSEFFGSDKPARTTLAAGLMHPDLLVEIEAWAVASSGGPTP